MLKVVGFINKSVCKYILYGMIFCIIYYLIVIGVNFILGYSIGIELFFIVGIVGILCKYIIVGFLEEILCRGYVLKFIYNEKYFVNKVIIV